MPPTPALLIKLNLHDPSAGMSSVQTLLLFGTSSALDDFLSKTSGSGSLVLGQDVKIAAMSDLGWGALENGGGALDGSFRILLQSDRGAEAEMSVIAQQH